MKTKKQDSEMPGYRSPVGVGVQADEVFAKV